MKKKMLFMAAIAGLVSLGSCVKDDVSASVEAVRNAKANALNAEANRDNATAEHTRAISAALVAVQQATARNTEALAKAQELTNQVKAAALEAEIAKQIAVYEKDLAQAKAQLQDELNNLEQSVRNAALAQYADVATAIFDYNVALGVFTTAQKDVIAAKVRLAAAKNDAKHAEEIRENAIAAWEKDIEVQEALIAKLQEVEAEGVDVSEALAQIAQLNAEIHNAMYEFENTEEVAALVKAGEDLATAKYNFDVVSATSFENVNAMVASALGVDMAPGTVFTQDPTTLTWSSNTAIVRIPAGATYYSAPNTLAGPVAAPWGGAYTDYYEAVGSPKRIKSKVAGYGFYDYTSYQYQFTADNFDEHGCPVPGTCSVTGKPAVVDGINDDVPMLVTTGAFALDGSNFAVQKYRVNELTKSAADDYFKNLPNKTKDALADAKADLKELQDKMGTASDKKDKKYTKKDGTDGGQTDYAKLNEAKENLDKAIEANTKAQSDLTGKPSDVKKALNALIAENEKKTFDGDKWIAAVVNLADALVGAYGAPAYDPNLKKYAYPANKQDAINYLFGINGPKDKTSTNIDETWMKDPDNVKSLFDSTDGNCIVKTWSSEATKKDYTDADKVEDLNAKAIRDAKAVNVVTVAKKRAAELGKPSDTSTTTQGSDSDTPTALTAYAAVAKANEAIFGKFNSDNQLITKGTTQKIAEKNDQIATKYEPEAAQAEANKAAYEAAIGAADVEAYDEAAAALSEAADNYNAAAKAVAGWVKANITDKNTEKNALVTVVKKQDIPAQIKAAEAQIATDKQNIANWENIETTPGAGDFDHNAEAIIAQAEVDLVDAIAALASATADLMAAQAQLEAIVGDLDIEYEYDLDDEPAEEPSEEPAEEPAEGGEETPAEGEGEGEGGEEA